MSADLLVVRRLSKKINSQYVIDDLSFTIRPAERVALFAPSGAGKTTLIHILSGLEPCDSGSFTFAKGCTPVTIFQEARLFPHLTVEENIFLPFQVQSRAVTPAVRQNYLQWMDVCSLNNCTRQYPYQLSGGMKQKVALIRGLLEKPNFVLMDEPFQSIDPASKSLILDHILHTNPQGTLLFVTHQAEEIPAFAQSVLYCQSSCLKQAVKIDTAAFLSVTTSLSLSLSRLESQRSEQFSMI